MEQGCSDGAAAPQGKSRLSLNASFIVLFALMSATNREGTSSSCGLTDNEMGSN